MPSRSAVVVVSIAIAVVCTISFAGQFYIVFQTKYDQSWNNHEFSLDFDRDADAHTKIGLELLTELSDASVNSNIDQRSPDGTFNGYQLYFETYTEGWHSNTHCIGENFLPSSWKHRSCQFQNLCFDIETKDYVLFSSIEQIELQNVLWNENLTFFDPASSMNTTVAIGGLNPKWGNQGINTLEWYPRLVSTDEMMKQGGYYSLHSETVLVPFHSFAGFNPGHLVWDDFLPLYTLLSSFQLEHKQVIPVMHFLKNSLWASCQRQWQKCAPMMKKFIPLLGAKFEQITSQQEIKVELKEENKSKFVCSPRGAAGMGMLTDHGLKLHGWNPHDYKDTHNVGRAGTIYAFRNWMMKNIGLEPEKYHIHTAPYKIVFSVSSSKSPTRSVSFEEQANHLRQYIAPKYNVDIKLVSLSRMTLVEQVDLMAGTSIFITFCGGEFLFISSY